MARLVVEPKGLASKREVEKEELRLGVLTQSYGKLFYLYFPDISYTKHPYARPGIGSIEDLEAASIDDVRAFHATYYRPDNAILVIAGNFDPAQLDRWVDQRSEEHTSELQSLMRISYAVFCLKKKTLESDNTLHLVHSKTQD